MNPHLFTKHLKQIKERETKLSQIIAYIEEKTGILLQEGEIQLSKKEIRFMTSSAKKAALIRKNISDVLTQLGYTVFI